jgi:hypothetical protein
MLTKTLLISNSRHFECGCMRKIAVLLLVLFLVAYSTICFLPIKSENRIITVPIDYPTLSSAIGNATYGDTILVKDGVYTEQTLVIDKTLTIKSEQVHGSTIILHPPQVPQEILGWTFVSYATPIDIKAD